MELITKRSRLDEIPDRYHEQYSKFYGTEYRLFDGARPEDIEVALRALPLPLVEADVIKFLGSSWFDVHCDECERSVDAAVVLGEQPNYESATATICTDCLRNALALYAVAPPASAHRVGDTTADSEPIDPDPSERWAGRDRKVTLNDDELIERIEAEHDAFRKAGRFEYRSQSPNQALFDVFMDNYGQLLALARDGRSYRSRLKHEVAEKMAQRRRDAGHAPAFGVSDTSADNEPSDAKGREGSDGNDEFSARLQKTFEDIGRAFLPVADRLVQFNVEMARVGIKMDEFAVAHGFDDMEDLFNATNDVDLTVIERWRAMDCTKQQLLALLDAAGGSRGD